MEGFPLTVKAFEDNKAESAAAPPVVRHSQQHIDVNGVAIGVNAGFFARQYRIEGLTRQTLRCSDEQLPVNCQSSHISWGSNITGGYEH